MTPFQVLGYLLLTAIFLILVRSFWMEIAVFIFALYIIGEIIVIALASAILWAVFVTGSAVGWAWTFLYFLIAYSMLLVVYYMIIKDIFNMIGDAIISFLKRIK